MSEAREKLRKAKAALDMMESIKPDYEKNKDAIKKLTDELGEKIADSMFSRDKMMKGLEDAHEEARRMSEPVIELTPEQAQVAINNGVRIDEKRRVSRNAATKLWQLGRDALGEMRNAEVLRRD